MDLLEWWPLLSEGGTFCGSNYTTEGLDLLSPWWIFLPGFGVGSLEIGKKNFLQKRRSD